jgi:hypothetical protein
MIDMFHQLDDNVTDVLFVSAFRYGFVSSMPCCVEIRNHQTAHAIFTEFEQLCTKLGSQ